MSKKELLTEEMALKNIINHALNVFPKSFINNSDEIIFEPRNNVFFGLKTVESELDFKCKMFEWLSRPISKGLNRYWSYKLLGSFNQLLGTTFTKTDMEKIYGPIGNSINRPLTIEFVKSGYDMTLLERDR